MRITFDPAKRDRTLAERGLDFARAIEVFADDELTIEDKRYDYSETRFFTAGYLDGRMIAVVWTPRGDTRHVISMRKANERERRKYQGKMGRP